MTFEEKQLLLKDLCSRLPYGVYVDIYSWQKDSPRLLVECVPEYIGEEVVLKNLAGRHSIKEVKPYLRPMSSMNEDEVNQYYKIRTGEDRYKSLGELDAELFDFYHKNHIDCRGLISMGLALEAPEGMYKND